MDIHNTIMEDENELLLNIARDLQTAIEIKDREFKGKTIENSFVARDMVECLLSNKVSFEREGAVEIGKKMLACGMIEHSTKDITSTSFTFRDSASFYRFTSEGYNLKVGKEILSEDIVKQRNLKTLKHPTRKRRRKKKRLKK